MLNNFIYAQSKAMFEERIAEVPNEAIVFIEDTKEIWTHGTYFDCSTLDPNIIPNIQTEIDELNQTVRSFTTWKNTELVGNTVSISAMVPNTFYYNNSEVTSFTISNFDVTDSPRDLYKCAFKTSSNGTTVSLPADVYWANGTMPVINPDTIYELSIERSLGVYKAIIVSFNLV